MYFLVLWRLESHSYYTAVLTASKSMHLFPKSFCKSKHITEHTLKDMFVQARTLELSFTAITKFIYVKN
jgi:hypothetical protein